MGGSCNENKAQTVQQLKSNFLRIHFLILGLETPSVATFFQTERFYFLTLTFIFFSLLSHPIANFLHQKLWLHTATNTSSL